MSLPYFTNLDWEVEVVTVDEKFSDLPLDDLLEFSVPDCITIHKINAFSKKWTSRFGLGSLALRSIWYYFKEVNKLLSIRKFDLIYFSTTQFPILILGAYWKRKFHIPFVIDMQDLWHSDYYQDKPRHQQPAKYWFSYRLNKFLEPIAMNKVDGLISVSQGYLDTLSLRYPNLKSIPQAVITFGAYKKDLEIAIANIQNPVLRKKTAVKHVVYVGRGGYDLASAIQLLWQAIRQSFLSPEQIHFSFIGTSYAPNGSGIPTIKPSASEAGLAVYVTESTDRVPFYEALNILSEADALFIPGSDDENYTASKVYPYIMADKPLFAVFHKDSSAGQIIRACNAGHLNTFDQPKTLVIDQMADFIKNLVANNTQVRHLNKEQFDKYSAENMTLRQVELFNNVINA